jgi:hypothetical protein
MVISYGCGDNGDDGDNIPKVTKVTITSMDPVPRQL